MQSDRRTLTLNDLGRIVTGKTPRTHIAEFFGGDIPFITPTDMDGQKTMSSAARTLTQDGAESVRGSRIPKGAVMVSCIGSDMGKVAIAGCDAVTNQQINSIIVQNDVEPEYVYYNLSNRRVELKRLAASGSTLPLLNKGNFGKIDIELPSREEQQAVVTILGALDDKIELNRRMNATLETMAQALFKEWFVDGVKEEWEVTSLCDHIEAVKGLSYKGSGLSDQGRPMHNLNSIYEFGRYKYEGIKWYTGEYKERHICKAGDVIVANTEQGFDHLLIASAALIPKRFGEEGIFTHHLYRVRPLASSYLTNHFIYLLLTHPFVREQMHGYTNGTTVNSLSKEGLERPTFRLPPVDLIEKFDTIVAPLFERQEVNHEESETLKSLRDTLLPKLMRGEVRVKSIQNA